MIEAYCTLHDMGIAHSVEAWKDGKLVGGLYGVSLGKNFFGESMFSDVSNASKAAFIMMAKKLHSLGFGIIDCQVYTAHLESLGAVYISRKQFIETIRENQDSDEFRGDWSNM